MSNENKPHLCTPHGVFKGNCALCFAEETKSTKDHLIVPVEWFLRLNELVDNMDNKKAYAESMILGYVTSVKTILASYKRKKL